MGKARKIPHFNPDSDLNTCLAKILRTRFKEMVSYEKGTIEGKDIEALHDMRVASRRVQAVMKVFRGAFSVKAFRKQYKIIRGIKDILGEVRHYDVFIEMLETSPPAPLPKGRQRKGEKLNDNAMSLLIVRQKNLREQKRKSLVSYLNYLNKNRYKEKFVDFL